MTWYLAPALSRLRTEINTLWPMRDRTSDGAVGDTSHAARKSDHNPDYSAGGIVRAIDIDEDLAPGMDSQMLIPQLIRDPRVAYVIYEGRIWQNPAVFSRGGWLPYTGVNAHEHHVHVSVRRGARWDSDASPWGITRTAGSTTGPGRHSLPDVSTSPVTPITPKPGPLNPEDDDMHKILAQLDPQVDGRWVLADFMTGTYHPLANGLQLDIVRSTPGVRELGGPQPVGLVAGLVVVPD